MTAAATSFSRPRARRRFLSQTHIPLLATTLVYLLLYGAASWKYDGFFSWGVFVNLLQDNAVLGLAAIGMTFVIQSGGIDLSVGAVVGCTSIVGAELITKAGWSPQAAISAVLTGGALFGAAQGGIVHFFRLPPFLVTLAGMFLARGVGLVISLESVQIEHPFYMKIADFSFQNLPGTELRILPMTALIFLGVLLAGIYIARWTRFGRNVYAIGGSEPSAVLMGLPVGRTKVLVYALSGFCAALAGVVYTFYTLSGSAAEAGKLLELDAIAAAVIGGTLLSGGVGTVFGTLLGVLIYGTINTAIIFDGRLNSWWTRIGVGALLLAFVLLQRMVESRASRR
ncbi:MAG: galactofuranose ABC transporter, permease protein YjfF [Planctomycetota bacterium]